MLYSVPEAIDPINVTMGYTLSNTPVAGLMESIFDLQKHFRIVHGEANFIIGKFYHYLVTDIYYHQGHLQ